MPYSQLLLWPRLGLGPRLGLELELEHQPVFARLIAKGSEMSRSVETELWPGFVADPDFGFAVVIDFVLVETVLVGIGLVETVLVETDLVGIGPVAIDLVVLDLADPDQNRMDCAAVLESLDPADVDLGHLDLGQASGL